MTLRGQTVCERLDHNIEDFEEMDTEPVSCEKCNRALDHEEMLKGALCGDHMPRLPLLAWVPPRIRRGYRR